VANNPGDLAAWNVWDSLAALLRVPFLLLPLLWELVSAVGLAMLYLCCGLRRRVSQRAS
jgi:hypothetical protein